MVLEDGARTVLTEIKSGKTVATDFFDGLRDVAAILGGDVDRVLVYGGELAQRRTEAQVLPWDGVGGYHWSGAATRRPRAGSAKP